jgi:hypothetical protein
MGSNAFVTAVTRRWPAGRYIGGMRLLDLAVLALAVLSCLALVALILKPGLLGI